MYSFSCLAKAESVLFSTELCAQCAKGDDGTEMRHVKCLPALHNGIT